eukprot:TRINITY_DN7068_c0_g1_i3.p1 TRINITY_DN7068_c0_g1~~TRINITY_DN7068_c0_g1_i3.p1  ORF type:complete len:532 (-),score=244.84 TRINITY_DN7068_c0_g1_i3:113-1708(-)
MPKSNASMQSRGSNRSRMSAKPVEVDETLFGSAAKNVLRNGTGATPKEDRLLGSRSDGRSRSYKPQTEEAKAIAKRVRDGDFSHPEVMVLPASEIERMRNEAIIISKEEELNQKMILAEQKEKQQAAAKARKQRMQEMEEQRKKAEPLSEIAAETQAKNELLLNKAQEAMLAQTDEVKHMNQMMVYARCVTIRDKQLEEKKRLRDEVKHVEKRKDLMMEIERLKMIKYYEEEEKKKKEELRRGHEVIIDQIKERELLRLREREEEEAEGQQMLKAMAELQKEEGENNIKRKLNQKKRLDEIYEANQKAILVKQKRQLEEKEEEDKIVKYNIEKAQKEQEYLLEQQRIKDEKEREVQRLREQQERAYDRQAEIDALRAKRAMEEAERRAREKERREAEQRELKNKELNAARHEQALQKQRQLEEQAKLDRDEFQRVITQQKIERDNELKQEIERNALRKKHAEELRKQIATNEEVKKQGDRDKFEEGKKIRDNLDRQKKLLENVKEQKLTDLKSIGIPDKYTGELARKKIQI